MSGFPEAYLEQLLASLLTDDIKVMAVASSELPIDLTSVQYIADITLAARLVSSASLSGKSVTDGVFDADNVTLVIPDGEECGALVYYHDTGNVATSEILFVDDDSTNLPTTGNGAAVNVTFDAAGIFGLGQPA